MVNLEEILRMDEPNLEDLRQRIKNLDLDQIEIGLTYIKSKETDLAKKAEERKPENGITAKELELQIGIKYLRIEKELNSAKKKREDFRLAAELTNPANKELDLKIYELIAKIKITYEIDRRLAREAVYNYSKSLNNEQNEDGIEEKYAKLDALLDKVEKKGKKPAYIIVFQYDDQIHEQYIGPGVFKPKITKAEGHPITRTCIGDNIFSEKVFEEIYEIGLEDKAILVDSSGTIVATNTQLEPTFEKHKKHTDNDDYNNEHGLVAGGNTRLDLSRLTARAMIGTAVYAHGESGITRRFYGEEFTASTNTAEQKIARKNIEKYLQK